MRQCPASLYRWDCTSVPFSFHSGGCQNWPCSISRWDLVESIYLTSRWQPISYKLVERKVELTGNFLICKIYLINQQISFKHVLPMLISILPLRIHNGGKDAVTFDPQGLLRKRWFNQSLQQNIHRVFLKKSLWTEANRFQHKSKHLPLRI